MSVRGKGWIERWSGRCRETGIAGWMEKGGWVGGDRCGGRWTGCVCEKERDTIIERETYSLEDRETGWMDGLINR